MAPARSARGSHFSSSTIPDLTQRDDSQPIVVDVPRSFQISYQNSSFHNYTLNTNGLEQDHNRPKILMA